MDFSLAKIKDEDVLQFKKDMQEAFQKGFEDVYGKTNGIILPEQDIDSSLNEKGSIAYKAIHIPGWLWIWGSVIAIIKIGNIIRGYVSKKQFISLHTIMNKVTGLLLFLLPLTLSFVELKYSSLVVCSIATFSAIQEGVYIVTGCESK